MGKPPAIYLHLFSPPQAATYHTRAREGHLAPIGSPLLLRTISVGKGPIEDLPDVCHVVHTDSKALEHSTAKGKQGPVRPGQGGWGRGRGKLAPQAIKKMIAPAENKDWNTRYRGRDTTEIEMRK